MNIGELHTKCKTEMRKAFEEFKRQLHLGLFRLDIELLKILQYNMSVEIKQNITKNFIENNTSLPQIKYFDNIIREYSDIALKTSNNYTKKKYNSLIR